MKIEEMNEVIAKGWAGNHSKAVFVSDNHVEAEAESKGRPIKGFSGAINYHGPPVSIDEINETIAMGWAGLLDT